MWWDFRNEVEKEFGIPPMTKAQACKYGHYIDITRNVSIEKLNSMPGKQ
jgi:hypothetical protein